MKTKAFRPLFLILMIFVIVSCTRSASESQVLTEDEIEISKFLSHAENTRQNNDQRLTAAASAYKQSLKTGNSILIYRAFNIYYALLKNVSVKSASDLLSRYASLAKKKQDTLNLGHAYFELGNEYATSLDDNRAFEYYNLSASQYELSKDSLQMAHKLLLLADIYWQHNDFVEVENTSTQVLSLLHRPLQNALDSAYAVSANNNHGLAYNSLSDFNSAKKSFAYARMYTRDSVKLATIKNNYALVLMDEGRYTDAVSTLRKIVKSPAVQSNPELYAKALDNLGYSLLKTGQSDALPLFQKAIDIRKEIDDQFGMVPSLIHLSEFYSKSNRSLAATNALAAYQIATSLQSTNDRLSALSQLRTVVSGADLEKYSSKYIFLRDSMEQVRRQARNQFAKYRYDSALQKEDNLKLKADNTQKILLTERAENRSNMLILGLLCGVLAIAAGYFFMRKHHRREKLYEGYKAEIRISKKVHDELANDMYHAMTFAGTQDLSDPQKRESLINTLDGVYSRTRDISRENIAIDTNGDYGAQLREMLSEYSGHMVKVLVQGLDGMLWNDVSGENKVMIYRVLQELMVNMNKHSSATIAAIRFENHGRKNHIYYSDNGVGVANSKLILKNGLRNVENRIEAIGGSVTFDSEPGKGLKIKIIYPPKS